MRSCSLSAGRTGGAHERKLVVGGHGGKHSVLVAARWKATLGVDGSWWRRWRALVGSGSWRRGTGAIAGAGGLREGRGLGGGEGWACNGFVNFGG